MYRYLSLPELRTKVSREFEEIFSEGRLKPQITQTRPPKVLRRVDGRRYRASNEKELKPQMELSRNPNPKSEYRNPKQIRIRKARNPKRPARQVWRVALIG